MSNKPSEHEALAELEQRVTQLLGPLEFGSVELIFHHGKLVQLERNEKFRLDKTEKH